MSLTMTLTLGTTTLSMQQHPHLHMEQVWQYSVAVAASAKAWLPVFNSMISRCRHPGINLIISFRYIYMQPRIQYGCLNASILGLGRIISLALSR